MKRSFISRQALKGPPQTLIITHTSSFDLEVTLFACSNGIQMVTKISNTVYLITKLISLMVITLTLSPRMVAAESDGWKSYLPGIALRSESLKSENLLKIFAARIDTKAKGIRFFVTPSNGDEPSDTSARSTSEFLHEFSCQLAINGSVFSPYAKLKGDPLDILGLSISEGSQYSKPNRFHAIIFSPSGKPSIVTPPFETKGVQNGLSGYYTVVRNGKNQGSERKRAPRTIAGVSRDDRYLILAVFDGRQSGYSDGATLREAGEWIKRFGAWNALNLDGGGSSTLVVEGGDGTPLLLNKPSDGTERRVANHLCIYAMKPEVNRK